jgi:hypothetical protein
MTRGIDQFYLVLRDYKKLFASAVAIGAMPFVAAISSLSPPWPEQIAPITAIAQLCVLILVFQLLQSSTKRTINKVMVFSFAALFAVSLGYLTLLLSFTTQLPEDKTRTARGFSCTYVAQSQYGDKCPFLGRDEMNEANYISTRLWTEGSITMVHVSLIASWTGAFMALACFVGSFVVFQQRESKTSRRSRSTAPTP